jgi:MATE family multidrug resistance protein
VFEAEVLEGHSIHARGSFKKGSLEAGVAPDPGEHYRTASWPFGHGRASPEEEALANAYFQARIWGAPASLSSLAAMGVLIGRGQSKNLLLIQLLVNGLNVVLDVLFVTVLDWGAQGVGWGTAIAEWCGALLAVAMVLRLLKLRFQGGLFVRVFETESLRATLRANADVMIRTFAMILGFSYFADQGARFGTATLAANHILLQFVSLSAFFLDGFAHVAETLVGAAKGRRSLLDFDASVKRTSELAISFALILGAGAALLGPAAVDLLTDIEEVRTLAKSWLPPVVVYVCCSVVAFQLDGIFIGTTSTRPLRNASIFSVAGFWLISLVLIPWGKSEGLWWSFVGYVVLRGASLSVMFLFLRQSLFSQRSSINAA